MEELFEGTGVSPTWVVGAGERETYAAALAAIGRADSAVVEGGKLTPSRNKATELAKAKGQFCVQLSDDLQHITAYAHKDDGSATTSTKATSSGPSPSSSYRFGWRKPRNQQEANQRSQTAAQYPLSPVGAAQLIECGMRAAGAKYGGVFPCMNGGFAFNNAPFTTGHFIVGDFIVVDPASPLRFDETFRLKEDYDLTAQHLHKYGVVCRLNRILVKAVHRDNPGGAVADRNATLEKQTIKLLRAKWPGVFLNHRRKLEVLMNWKFRKPFLGFPVVSNPPPPKKKGMVLLIESLQIYCQAN